MPTRKKKFKIMIVEGKSSTTKLYKKEIPDQYQVDFFDNARTALFSFEYKKYDLVIADLILLLKSGEDLIHDIKYISPKQKIAVIASSPLSLKLQGYNDVQVFEKPKSITNVIEHILLGKQLTDNPADPRRKHPRFKVDINAKVIAPNDDTSPLHITNLSLGGFFVKGKTLDFANKTSIPIELSLFDKRFIFHVTKRWEKQGLGMGVKFENLTPSEATLLELYLDAIKSDKDH